MITWDDISRAADVVSIAAIFVSVGGFIVTATYARSAKTAAEAATRAARFKDNLVGLSAAISMGEEIKRLHRSPEWKLLPERYGALKKNLIEVRTSWTELNDQQNTVIQKTIVFLSGIETEVERTVQAGKTPDAAKLNRQISQHLDDLLHVLVALKRGESKGSAQ